jgi:hypothetical protein
MGDDEVVVGAGSVDLADEGAKVMDYAFDL